jgi:RHS repeat-associated protein
MTDAVGARNPSKVDAGVVQALLQARYYDGSKGEFLSEDPVFLGNPKQQVLSDPQTLNSYSYGNDNPINKSDPLGLASYVWANGGGMTGVDTWNTGTYYQTADNAMLRANAAQMQAEQPGRNVGGLIDWTSLVMPGGAWDYKSRANPVGGGREFYFFGNQLVNADTYGNMSYGYVGTAGGFGPNALKGAAGLVQIMVGRSQLSWYSSNFDNPKSQGQIQYGINSYNSAAVNAVSNFNSSNLQSRASAVSTFNSASGATSNSSKLWSTPNGAIVTWAGGVVSPGIK